MIFTKDLMTVNPATVSPETTLKQILETMRKHQCRQLPVLDADGTLVGIVTDRDIRLAMRSPLVLHERWEDDMLLETLPARGCMTSQVMTIDQYTPAVSAAKILLEHKFGALPVMDGKRLVGIITVSDFLRKFIQENPD